MKRSSFPPARLAAGNRLVTLVSALALLFGFAFPLSGAGQVRYIDYDSGSDANDGLSASTAWKHCPGDSNATGSAAGAVPVAGNTLLFKGGVVYRGQLPVRWSGSPGAPIVYDGNSAGSWGSGRAILDGCEAPDGVGFSIVSQSCITIKNFEIRHFGNYADMSCYDCGSNPLPDKNGTGIYLKQAGTIEIRGNLFQEIGIWQNGSPVKGDADVSGTGVSLASGSDVTIAGNEFTRMSTGVGLMVFFSEPMAITGVTIAGNDFHGYLRWPVCCGVGGDSATLQGITISGNSIRNYMEHAQGSFCGERPHLDGIILLVGNAAPGQNYRHTVLGTPLHPFRICNNVFYQNATTGGGTAFLFLTTFGGTVYVYNNTFINSRCGEGCIYVQDGLRAQDGNPAIDYHFWNNTVYDATFGIFLRSMTPEHELDRPGYQLDIRNNLLCSADTTKYSPYLVVMESDGDADTLNHCVPTVMDDNGWFVTPRNPYQRGAATPVIAVWANAPARPAKGYSVAAFGAATGLEQHGLYADPQFVDGSYGPGANSGQNILSLRSTSPDVDRGTSLAAYFTADHDGTARPQGPGWDIGAFEYQTPLVRFLDPVRRGWNLVSLNVRPVDSSASAVFGDSVSHRSSGYPKGFILVKDLTGRVHCPALGTGGPGSLDFVHTGAGYQLYTDSADTIRAWGSAVDAAATPLSLLKGWNLIGYLPQSSMPVAAALQAVDSALYLMKNNAGDVCCPYYGIDNIKIMRPGEGYFLYLRSAASFTYPGVSGKRRKGRELLSMPAPAHYPIHRNTGDNATFLAARVTAGEALVPEGCEVAAFDRSGAAVGAGTVVQGRCAFPVWGDDRRAGEKTGCTPGEPLHFRLWDGTRECPLVFTSDSGGEPRYAANGIMAGVLRSSGRALAPSRFRLVTPYPNPFRKSVRIAFDVPAVLGGPDRQEVAIDIYDTKGRLVRRFVREKFGAGRHVREWDAVDRAAAVGSGMFIVSMRANGFEQRAQIFRVE